MNYVGKWKFHSIGTFTDDGMAYMNSEEFLASSMPYIDTSDEEAVASEMKERRAVIGAVIEITDDGKLYMLLPIPEDAPEDELKATVDSGELMLRDGMLTEQPIPYEIRDGELWVNMGMGEDDGFTKASDGEFVMIVSTRYTKAE